ncbi:nonsense-mediated mRNA decay factor SMG8 [Culicoides brevitarsis]|uniref:nonsense-mediated mRNA decay factor SMG8 n=1 Tax=Culicoides brevitarsis TaxID=469753 RepID=UPI00307BBC13
MNMKYLTCKFPDISPEISELFSKGDKPKVIIGILGRSLDTKCNKLKEFDILQDIQLLDQLENGKDGDIRFFGCSSEDTIYVHFNTIYDFAIMRDCLEEISSGKCSSLESFVSFNSHARTTFGRILLFALQVCHILVLTEPGPCFDASYLTLFKSLKIIREKYVLKFLPKMLKNVTSMKFLEVEGRVCSPRVLFLFESALQECENDLDWLRMEEAMEEHIYQQLRNEFIITNNSSMSLFSVSRKRRFVYIAKEQKFVDAQESSHDILMSLLNGTLDSETMLEQMQPYKGFAKSWNHDTKKETFMDMNKKRFQSLIMEHVREALSHGFDDNLSKYRGKGHFSIPSFKQWIEAFRLLYKIFIENTMDINFEANDAQYAAYIENFHGIVDIDEKFFEDACQKGLELGMSTYNEGLPHHYSFAFHEQRKRDALAAFSTIARGPLYDSYYEKLKDACESVWGNGKQACEHLSLRGNPCMMAKHTPKDPNEHSSGVIFISACNCGKVQGNRADPYTVKKANYDFYQTLAMNCPNCLKIEKFRFPVFQPSVKDFKATALKLKSLIGDEASPGAAVTPDVVSSIHLSGSQKTQSQDNLSIPDSQESPSDKSDKESVEEDDEIVIKIGEKTDEAHVERLISTTEYLASMIQVNSPQGVLPQFPSFSLVCVGPSSIYSHNTGLPESTQSGFLSGSNFLLPWDMKIRLEHQQSWAERYEKTRQRRKHGNASALTDGQNFNLKIFVGCEYECQRGHRFFLSSPTQVLKGSQSIVRDSGSKIVSNDMPLYTLCPCTSATKKMQMIAQLMRVHIVTPKAPVNVIIDPKVKLNVSGNSRTGNSYIFTTGVQDKIKLSQSTYWILRLPFVYESDNGPILPPMECTADTAINYGCLVAGMFGVKESDSLDSFE